MLTCQEGSEVAWFLVRLLGSILTVLPCPGPVCAARHPSPPATSPQPALQRLCPRLTASNPRLYPHTFLTFSVSTLSSTCFKFLCSWPFSSYALLFLPLSSVFSTQQFPYWAWLVFVLSSVSLGSINKSIPSLESHHLEGHVIGFHSGRCCTTSFKEAKR